MSLNLLFSKVTFKDPEAAMRACQNPSPVIDGRRANCNLASLGANKNRTSTFQHGLNSLSLHLSNLLFLFSYNTAFEFLSYFILIIDLTHPRQETTSFNVGGYLLNVKQK